MGTGILGLAGMAASDAFCTILYNWYFLQAFNFRTPQLIAPKLHPSNEYLHSNIYIYINI